MDFAAPAQWAATGVIAVALYIQIRRNGKAQKRRDEETSEARAARDATIDEKLKHINGAITSPDSGLAALKSEMGGMITNCASVTSGFKERIKNLEKEK